MQQFKFEAIWPRFSGFLEAVVEGWCCTLLNADAYHVLDYKLHNTTKSLKRWSSKRIATVHLQLIVAKAVVFKLDQAQDHLEMVLKPIVLKISVPHLLQWPLQRAGSKHPLQNKGTS
jgi:hypothetical protein